MLNFNLHFDIIKVMVNSTIAMFCFLIASSLVKEDWISVILFAGLILGLAFCLFDKRLIAGIWIIGIPTIFVFPNNILDVLPFVTVDRLLFVLLLGLLTLSRCFNKTPAIPFNYLEKAIFFYLAWMLIKLLWTLPDKDIPTIRTDLALYIQGIFMPMASYFIAYRIHWQEKDIQQLLVCFLLAGVFLSLIGALQFFLGITWFVPTYMEVVHQGRATGTFSNAVEYGNVLSITIIISMLLYVRSHGPILKVLLVFCMGFLCIGLILCMTRGPIVALAASFIFLIFADLRIRPFFLTSSIIAVVGVAIAAPFFLDLDHSLDHLIARFSELSPIYNRLALWATAVNMVYHNPLTGLDFSRTAFSAAKPDYITSFGSVPAIFAEDVGVPHMEYLHIAVLSGLIGLFLLIKVLQNAWKLLSEIRQRQSMNNFCGQLATYTTAMFITFIVNGFFVDTIFNNYFPILIYFMLGVISSLDNRSSLQSFYEKN